MSELNARFFFNPEDTKLIKKDCLGKIFPSTAIFLLLFLVIFIYFSLKQKMDITFYMLLFTSLVISAMIFLIMTRNHRLDLKIRRVLISKSVIEDKVYKKDYEPGSTSTPVNLLSLLFFKKIFMREMKEMHIYYMKVDGVKVFLNKDDFSKFNIGDEVEVRWSENTKLFLGIIKDGQEIAIKQIPADKQIYL